MPTSQENEATGYSERYSFDEAFGNAIKALSLTPSHPDELFKITLVEIGAEIGGIVPLNRLLVRLRRETETAT
jgi:hypothetical protein